MTTNTVKNAKITTESVVNFVFFETLTTEKSATGVLFGGHVRLVFTLILFIYIICVSATITSFAELPLSIIEASRDEVLYKRVYYSGRRLE